MTIPAHDPEIEQEAERMLSIMESQYRVAHYTAETTPLIHEKLDILRRDFLPLLRELATLRRGAAEPSLHETIAGITTLRKERDEALAFKTYVHQRLDEAGIPTHPDGKHSREGCRVGDRLDILVDRATAKPFDDATLRAIEERAAYLKAQKRIVDDGNWKGFDVTTAAEQIKQVSLLLSQDVDTLLAALRTGWGRGRKAMSNVPQRNQVPGHPTWYFGVFSRNERDNRWEVDVVDYDGNHPSLLSIGRSRDECVAIAVKKIEDLEF